MDAYEINDTLTLTTLPRNEKRLSLYEALSSGRPLRLLYEAPPTRTPSAFVVTHEALYYRPEPSIRDLSEYHHGVDLNQELIAHLEEAIEERNIIAVNKRWKGWEKRMEHPGILMRRPAKIHLLALGDVGASCLLALSLLNDGDIDEIGIYDVDHKMAQRWALEINQCAWSFKPRELPKVRVLREEELFEDCDVFVFAASAGVPMPGLETGDVRQIQYAKNKIIVAEYAKKARLASFQGLFVVLSDPVEPLTTSAWLASNEDGYDGYDWLGLRPEQVEGYGLGVMHSRGISIADKIAGAEKYPTHGRAYGRHGEGLILADDPIHYDDAASQALTKAVVNLNMDIRTLGFKPYVAPAVSSGAMSLLSRLRGNRLFSAIFIDGCHYGCPNHLIHGLPVMEALPMDEALYTRIHNGHRSLREQMMTDYPEAYR